MTGLADWLNKLPMVEWDRAVPELPDEPLSDLWGYGWITRDDGHRDFVAVKFERYPGGVVDAVEYVTSSAAHSDEIGGLLWPEYGGVQHATCVPITDLADGIRVAPWRSG